MVVFSSERISSRGTFPRYRTQTGIAISRLRWRAAAQPYPTAEWHTICSLESTHVRIRGFVSSRLDLLVAGPGARTLGVFSRKDGWHMANMSNFNQGGTTNPGRFDTGSTGKAANTGASVTEKAKDAATGVAERAKDMAASAART